MKRALSLFIIFILLTCLALPAGAAGYSAPVEAASALLYNLDSGEMLFAKNASGSVLPGRSALLMAALVTVENARDLSESVTVTLPEGTKSDGLFSGGETVTIKDLVTAMVLAGSENAALAAATAVSYSPESFLALMNAEASALGMSETVYTTVSGAPFVSEDTRDVQNTTINDFFKLMQAISQNEVLSGLLSSPSGELSGGRRLANGNTLVTDSPAPDSDPLIKGGSAGLPIAGEDACLTLTAVSNEKNLLCLMLGGSSVSGMISSAESLLDYGAGRMQTIPLSELLAGLPLSYTSKQGAGYTVEVEIPDQSLSLPDGFDRSAISVKLDKNDDNTGTATYLDGDGNELAVLPAVFTLVRSEGEVRGRAALCWIIGILTLFCCIVLILALRRFYSAYCYQREIRLGSRLDGAEPITPSTQILKGSFNYHFPVWALWGIAVLLIIIIALCFNLYPT